MAAGQSSGHLLPLFSFTALFNGKSSFAIYAKILTFSKFRYMFKGSSIIKHSYKGKSNYLQLFLLPIYAKKSAKVNITGYKS